MCSSSWLHLIKCCFQSEDNYFFGTATWSCPCWLSQDAITGVSLSSRKYAFAFILPLKQCPENWLQYLCKYWKWICIFAWKWKNNWDIVEEKVRPWLQVHDTSQFYWRWQGEAGGRSCNLQIRSNRSQCSLAWVCINFPLTVITGFLNAMNRIKTVRLTFLGTPVTSIRQGLTVRLSISTDRPAPVREQRQINLYIWYFVAVQQCTVEQRLY